MFPAFTPVWNAGVLQFARRDQIAYELIELKKPYENLSRASKDKVNKLLELGRLSGHNYEPDASGGISVTNNYGTQGETHGGGAALSRLGETI
jgi:hypothetical protein